MSRIFIALLLSALLLSCGGESSSNSSSENEDEFREIMIDADGDGDADDIVRVREDSIPDR